MLPPVWPCRTLDLQGQPAAAPSVPTPAVPAPVTIPPATAASDPPSRQDQETQIINPPYEHWPSLPIAEEPDLSVIGPGQVGLQRRTAFMYTKPSLSKDESRWHGAMWSGSGSSGAVGLWCEVDEQHNVIDRIVIKDNATYNHDAWPDPKN
ncbi:hypothetical protein E8E12_009546 [Didymella heteroderae]|uniref:Uncharacterized protein n=1 Tax=Didymella heteroderae TaxID=1769908 RepID=A0A9P5C6N8_9PLEO|nr:hypothetical protein E8E12_009546 [Didymella heteroderae]